MRLTDLNSITETGVSHNGNIRKKTLASMGEIENLIYFSRAVFPPGEVADSHRHEDMTEVFFIASGFGQIIVDGEEIKLNPG